MQLAQHTEIQRMNVPVSRRSRSADLATTLSGLGLGVFCESDAAMATQMLTRSILAETTKIEKKTTLR